MNCSAKLADGIGNGLRLFQLSISRCRVGQIELFALTKELVRIVVDDLANHRLGMAPFTHFDDQIRYCGRF